MKLLFDRLSRLVDFIAASLLAAIFVIFLLQIISRYVFNSPIGWTLELINTFWLWLIFIGAAFVVRERDHVEFDMLYLAAPRKVRIVFALISAGAIAIAMLWALPATWDWVSFLSRRKNLLGIPMSWVVFVYIVFMVGTTLRYGLHFGQTWRNGPPDHEHELVDEGKTR